MLYNEKLDFLMNLTNTTNSTLAKYCFVDPSYISRLRRGKRTLVKNADYVEKMAHYFSVQINENYQRKILEDLLKTTYDNLSNEKNLYEKIYDWLTESNINRHSNVSSFFNSTAKINFSQKNNQYLNNLSNETMNLEDISLYFGISGKRKATINFLNEIIHSKNTNTLLLYSDEPMNWLTDDPSFLKLWSTLLTKVIKKGNRIKIIHTVSRNLDEMLQALSKWMPLYMTGAIEPFYYPKKRDGIAKRTLFVFKNEVGLTSTTIGQMNNQTLNILLKDEQGINSLEKEFNNYLNLCKPLMHVFNQKNQSDFFDILLDFEKEESDSIYISHNPSILTLPKKIYDSMISSSNIFDQPKMINFYNQRLKEFNKLIIENEFYELITLPTFSNDNQNDLNFAFDDIFEIIGYQYSLNDYINHLENLIKIMKANKNYNVIISDKKIFENFKIYVKEDLGVIILKTSKPEIIFAINESNMTAAIWDYCQEISEKGIQNQNKVIKKITKIIKNLNN